MVMYLEDAPLLDLTVEEEQQLFVHPTDVIYLVEAGSVTHGTKDEMSIHSDYDLRGVFVGPLSYYIGLTKIDEANNREIKDRKIDAVTYEIKKFMSLVLAANPSILEHLYVDPRHRIVMSDSFERNVIEQRDSFLSSRAYNTFMGYAHQQFVKLDHIDSTRDLGAKRKESVNKYGYDTKNAMHLFRLLHMGIELLTTGNMSVRRENADFLKAVRNGLWTVEQVKKEAQVLFDHMEDLRKTGKIILPEEPNFAAANWAVQDVIRDHYELLPF